MESEGKGSGVGRIRLRQGRVGAVTCVEGLGWAGRPRGGAGGWESSAWMGHYLALPYLGFCWRLGREEEEMGFLALFASAWRRVVYGAVRCLW